MRNPNFKTKLVAAAVAAVFATGAWAQTNDATGFTVNTTDGTWTTNGAGGSDLSLGTSGTATIGDGATIPTATLNSSGISFTDYSLAQTPSTTFGNQIISIDDGTGQTILINQTGIAVANSGAAGEVNIGAAGTLGGGAGDITATGTVNAANFAAGDQATQQSALLNNTTLSFIDYTNPLLPSTSLNNQSLSIDDGAGQTVLINQTGIAVGNTGAAGEVNIGTAGSLGGGAGDVTATGTVTSSALNVSGGAGTAALVVNGTAGLATLSNGTGATGSNSYSVGYATTGAVTTLANGASMSMDGNDVSLLNNVPYAATAATGHGLTIGAASTTLNGGTNSSSLTLQDSTGAGTPGAIIAVGTATTAEVNLVQGWNDGTGTANSTGVTIGDATTSSNLIQGTTNNMTDGTAQVLVTGGAATLSNGTTNQVVANTAASADGVTMSGTGTTNGLNLTGTGGTSGTSISGTGTTNGITMSGTVGTNTASATLNGATATYLANNGTANRGLSVDATAATTLNGGADTAAPAVLTLNGTSASVLASTNAGLDINQTTNNVTTLLGGDGTANGAKATLNTGSLQLLSGAGTGNLGLDVNATTASTTTLTGGSSAATAATVSLSDAQAKVSTATNGSLTINDNTSAILVGGSTTNASTVTLNTTTASILTQNLNGMSAIDDGGTTLTGVNTAGAGTTINGTGTTNGILMQGTIGANTATARLDGTTASYTASTGAGLDINQTTNNVTTLLGGDGTADGAKATLNTGSLQLLSGAATGNLGLDVNATTASTTTLTGGSSAATAATVSLTDTQAQVKTAGVGSLTIQNNIDATLVGGDSTGVVSTLYLNNSQAQMYTNTNGSLVINDNFNAVLTGGTVAQSSVVNLDQNVASILTNSGNGLSADQTLGSTVTGARTAGAGAGLAQTGSSTNGIGVTVDGTGSGTNAGISMTGTNTTGTATATLAGQVATYKNVNTSGLDIGNTTTTLLGGDGTANAAKETLNTGSLSLLSGAGTGNLGLDVNATTASKTTLTGGSGAATAATVALTDAQAKVSTATNGSLTINDNTSAILNGGTAAQGATATLNDTTASISTKSGNGLVASQTAAGVDNGTTLTGDNATGVGNGLTQVGSSNANSGVGVNITGTETGTSGKGVSIAGTGTAGGNGVILTGTIGANTATARLDGTTASFKTQSTMGLDINQTTANTTTVTGGSGGGTESTLTLQAAKATLLTPGNSGLTINDLGQVSLVGGAVGAAGVANLNISANGNTVSLLNNVGPAVNTGQGLTIGATSTTLTGGNGTANPSTLTLQNQSATLAVGNAGTSVQLINATNTGAATGVTIGNTGAVNSTNLMVGSSNTIANANTYAAATSGIEVIAAGVDVKGGANTVTATTTNTITGGTGNTLSATTGNNAITAVAGANTITGQTGNTITANTGNNVISATTGANSMTAGTTNTITGGTGNTLSATTGNNTISAAAGANNISALTNTITGTTSNLLNSASNTIANNTTYAGATSAVQVISTGVDIKGAAISLNGATQVNGTLSSTGNANIATGAGTTNTFGSGAGSTNTIGNAGTSINTVTGATNTFNATTSNVLNSTSNLIANAATYGAATSAVQVVAAGVDMKGGANTITGTTNTITGATTLQNAAGGVNTVVVNAAGGATGTAITGTGTTNGVSLAGTVGANTATATLAGTNATYRNSNNSGLNVAAASTTLTGGPAGVVPATATSFWTASGSPATAAAAPVAQVGLVGSEAFLVNNTGHGISVNSTSTVVTGGTSSTALVLSDSGAKFVNTATNGTVVVSGLANGTGPTDAVTYQQFQQGIASVQNTMNQATQQIHSLETLLSRGIASTTAIANIPQVDQGKTFSLGVGLGTYNGYTAFAIGGSYRIQPNAVLKASVGTSGSGKTAFGIGAAMSW